MNITKAIIPVAGWGTRRLPITKTIEKCMLPIGNRPVVDYTVQDCIKAGITDIFFVVSEQSTQIRDYYRSNIDLTDYLRRSGKEHLLETIQPPKVNLHYVVQSSYGPYGTAVPVSLVVPQLAEGESVVVLMGDDCIYNTDPNKSEVARMIESAGEDSLILSVTVPHESVSKYGVIRLDDQGNFVEVVEKPSLETAPSNQISISKYVLNYKTLKLVEDFCQRTDIEGEYYIYDPLHTYCAQGGKIKVIQADGEYLDSGTVKNWLKANQIVIEDMDN
jgi:UTP--glucose-1-phosphate uridylyltransferase